MHSSGKGKTMWKNLNFKCCHASSSLLLLLLLRYAKYFVTVLKCGQRTWCGMWHVSRFSCWSSALCCCCCLAFSAIFRVCLKTRPNVAIYPAHAHTHTHTRRYTHTHLPFVLFSLKKVTQTCLCRPPKHCGPLFVRIISVAPSCVLSLLSLPWPAFASVGYCFYSPALLSFAAIFSIWSALLQADVH